MDRWDREWRERYTVKMDDGRNGGRWMKGGGRGGSRDGGRNGQMEE